MIYSEKMVANPQLCDGVLCIWEMRGYIKQEPGLSTRYLPKGQNLLVFNFGDEVCILDDPNWKYSNQNFFVVPAFSSCRIINQKNKVNLFGISFIRDGLYKLTKKSIPELIGNIPEDILSKCHALHSDLQHLKFDEKLIITEKFLLEHYQKKLHSPPFHEAVDLILASKGAIPISSISKKVYITERQLQRLFKSRMGITPKAFCKIVRINNFIEFILTNEKSIDWMDFVFKYGYHDQPHLISELKSIAKLSPNKLIKYRDTLQHRYLRTE